jgi:predicted dehydrogenase
MAIRVAMIGYGGVGAIHAAKLREEPDVELVSVWGPKREKASSFAVTHGIPRVCDSIAEVVSGADAVIIASPSKPHFEQARECLELGVNTLVEIPPCESAAEAEELASLAQRRGVMLGCAHTSRYAAPFMLAKKSIDAGALGKIQVISFVRHHKLRDRSWMDDALLHFSAHPIDQAFYLCGGLEPVGCVVLPDVRLPQTSAVLGILPSGAPMTISMTFASRIYLTRMMIVGDKGTIDTDGFSYLSSDLPGLEYKGDAEQGYHESIHVQDVAFLRACQGKGTFVSWDETLKVLRTIDRFRELAA